MPRDLTDRLEELKRDIERQDERWAAVETQMHALSKIGVVVSRHVVDDIDEAFSASSRAELSLHHTFC
jgi:hypothetical protein